MSWASRHRVVLGLGLTIGSFFVGFWAAELLDGSVPLNRGSIGFTAGGLALLGADLGSRRVGGIGEGVWRYLRPAGGPSRRGIPV
jgi:hypothetical protein